MKKYILYCVGLDGHFVKDSEHETIEDAENASADLGSKWYFNPFHVIVKGQTIKETGGSLHGIIKGSNKTVCLLSEKFKGKRFSTFIKKMKDISKLPEFEAAGCEDFEIALLEL